MPSSVMVLEAAAAASAAASVDSCLLVSRLRLHEILVSVVLLDMIYFRSLLFQTKVSSFFFNIEIISNV